jgi:4-amino-4-deoxy-L-arabinose transferase-like glycosyltransferase
VKHGHAGFPGYYFAVLPLVLLPFTALFLRLLPMLRGLWADPLDRFLLLWFVTVFAVFSFSDTKLPHYLVYGITPLFVLMARHRERLRGRWLGLLPPLLLMALLAALPEVLALAAPAAERLHEQAMFADGARALDWRYRLATAVGLLALVGLLLWRRPAVWQRLVLAGLVQTVVVFGFLVPRVFDVMQAPVKEAGLLARELDRPTVVYRTSMPSFSVYRQAITPELERPRPGQVIFLRVDKLERLARDFPGHHFVPIYRRGAVTLVQVAEKEAPNHG